MAFCLVFAVAAFGDEFLLSADEAVRILSAIPPWPTNSAIVALSGSDKLDPEALTAQKFLDMRTYADVPERICFCCDGGMNRSVMAANILNHLAKERDLPVICEARSAYQNTQGRPVPDAVWTTLEAHGIQPDRGYTSSRYLEEREYAHFSSFAAMTAGAMSRLSWMRVPEERVNTVSRFFHGISDPEYGEISHEEVLAWLYERAGEYLDYFEKTF